MENKPTRTLAADRAAGLATVPADALLFDVGPCKLAAGEAKDGKVPVKMRARGGQPIYHWYWGNVAHDMTGFAPAEPVIPIDYCHDFNEVLGLLNSFAPSNEGLDVGGELVSFAAEDRTAEVTHKARAGIPYQASIFFEPQVIEEILPGAQADVNGYKLTGPGLVIRKWTLRGVAICPYGYDPKTSTKLSARPGGDVPAQFSFSPESAMSKTETKPADSTKPAAELSNKPAEGNTTLPATDPRAEFQKTLKQFTEKFGAANGSAWAAEGMTYEQALEKHAEALAAQLAAAGKELTTAQQKLAAVPRGEEEPVSFGTNEKHEGGQTAPDKFIGLGKLSKFAAGLKMPATK